MLSYYVKRHTATYHNWDWYRYDNVGHKKSSDGNMGLCYFCGNKS